MSQRRYRDLRVTAHFTADGWPRPSGLIWDGAALVVESTGRRWEQADGRYMLARVTDGRVFELGTNGVRWWGRVASAPPPLV